MSNDANRTRQARYRARQREFRVVANVEVSLDDILWLESEGFLPAAFEQDRERVGKAIARFLARARQR